MTLCEPCEDAYTETPATRVSPDGAALCDGCYAELLRQWAADYLEEL